MDPDLLSYLEQRFASIDRRFDEVDKRFDEVDRRFEQVDRRFEQVDQRFQQIEQRVERVDQHVDQVDRRVASMDQRFDHVHHRLGTLETEVRGAWISIEDLRGQIKLVAEGVTNNNEQLERHREEVAKRFGHLESLVHRSYEDLDERVSRLEAAAG